ncbi:hypothetical protein [Polaribacter sargassicola]|uniref:hypothetical protein n=1 Tax=Polaribacter sargassicola TaxID=2836891 RepID=UPI001F458229|nr:hypothetical protein [Polaribacter sp. DS7-9]MCG1036559.1 hypothetical protein [Polaribacter sp. DS7-9]
MKKFILNTLLLLFITYVIATLIVIIFPSKYMDPTYSAVKFIKAVKAGKENSYKNFIIGDSRAEAGIKPNLIDTKLLNLSLGGSSSIEGYFILKEMLDKNIKIDTLIVSYGATHFLSSEHFFSHSLKLSLLKFKNVNEVFNDLNEDKLTFWKPRKEQRQMSNLENTLTILKSYLILLKWPLYYQTEITNSKFLRGNKNNLFYEDVVKNKGYHLYGKEKSSSDLNEEAKGNLNKFTPNLAISNALIKLLDLAKNNNIKVFYINVPFNETSYKNVSLDFKSSYNKYFATLKSKYPNFIFNSDLSYYKDGYFGDKSHLNDRGASKFSLIVNQKLKQ